MVKAFLLMTPLVGLGCLALGVLSGRSESAPEKGLELARLELVDGPIWILGDGGVGRPFLARLVLINNGKRPIKIWELGGSEASSCPQVVLADAQGRETVLRPQPILRLAGVAMAQTLVPEETVNIDLELLRLVDVASPPAPGEYTIRAVYTSEEPENPGVPGVWRGTLRSERLPMQIVPPRAPRAKP